MNQDLLFMAQNDKPYRCKIIQSLSSLRPPVESCNVSTNLTLTIVEEQYNSVEAVYDSYSGFNSSSYDRFQVNVESCAGSDVTILGNASFLNIGDMVELYDSLNVLINELAITNVVYNNVVEPYTTTLTLSGAIGIPSYVRFNAGFDWPAEPIVIPTLTLLSTTTTTIVG